MRVVFVSRRKGVRLLLVHMCFGGTVWVLRVIVNGIMYFHVGLPR